MNADEKYSVIETATFIKAAKKMWSEEEIVEIKQYLAVRPLDGDIVPKTGGLRKLRWGRAGMGKRGGARVIYYFHDEGFPVSLLYAYAKAKQSNLDPQWQKFLIDIIEELKSNFERQKGDK